jgi:DNA-directed RNA polymerase specialized sigma24 family protein
LTAAEIEQALEGDRTALAGLVRGLLPVIKVEVGVALVRRALPRRRDPRQEVEELSRDVVLYLLADGGHLLRMWDPARGRSLASFVRLIARQRVSQILHGHRGKAWSEDPAQDSAIERLAEEPPGERLLVSRDEQRALLERLRAHLNERGLELFQQIYVEQRPMAELAVEFKMTHEALVAWNTRTRNLARRLAREGQAPLATERR